MPKFLDTMDQWMRDVNRRITLLERRRGRAGGGAATATSTTRDEQRMDALEARIAALEQQLPPG